MSRELERALGFGARADVMLARRDGSRRLWIEFEISRADPVANHAKFAAAHLFEPRPTSDTFVSMVSSHVTRGRSNLAASAVYLMRAVGMSAFQTHLLPDLTPDRVHDLNQLPFDELLREGTLDVAPEIDRAVSVTAPVTEQRGHRIHFAANLFEVMLNVNAWNQSILTTQGAQQWGRRTVTFFVFSPKSGDFAPSKFCAFVPIGSGPAASRLASSMEMATYASLDESETRFDGHIARRHLTSRLSMTASLLSLCAAETRRDFDRWYGRIEPYVKIHPAGPRIIVAPTWW